MRNAFGFSAPPSGVTRFLIIIIAVYLVFALFGSFFGPSAYRFLVLDPLRTCYSFELWRIVTYAFLHDAASPMHIIFNSLMLYMIGPQLEDRWGERRFVIFVMAAIILGGLLVCASFLLGLSYASVVGFSAATMGLIVAWGLTFSRQNIYLFGLLPLTGMQLVWVTIGLEIIYAVSSNSISSAAHFGGIIAGFVFTFGLYKPQKIRQIWHRSIKRTKR